MINNDKVNLTMLAMPYIKGKYLHDEQATKIISGFENAEKFTMQCNDIYDSCITRNVIARHAYLSEKIDLYANSFEQVLLLSIGLDTKPDTLPALKNKACFGLDIAAEDIKNIYSYSQSQTKAEIIQCDFQKDINSKILDELKRTGMILSEPTYIIWEGGTFYINALDVYQTLQFFCANVNIIGCSMDFASKNVFLPPKHKKAEHQLQLLAKEGFPWRSFFSKQEIKDMFRKIGFTDIDITLHGEYEKKTLGNIELDEDVMYLVTVRGYLK
ncbi:class I SAM-dependent methyltransferase [Bacillus thuringiensis]|uniref:class I SAM-dependent methyltransferase n=1 Tax=Bacillus thuringiensis TaxID=1428 RepID=UPI000EE49903|nr:class I SAM-dependent methyltransferase [Bacillus thuringiensis]MDZ3952424.1 class I SAM-dependent methyltransferase [Bacillus thuringiensis]RGP45241.1 hypothetical protein BTW32_26155 [Bacillus thuringiensis]